MKKRIIVTVVGVALCAGGFASWHVYGARSVPMAQDAGARRTCRRGEAPGLGCANRHDWYWQRRGVQCRGCSRTGDRHNRADRFHRGPGRAPEQSYRATRSAPVSGGTPAGGSQPGARSGKPGQRKAKSRALHSVAEAGVCIGTAGNRPGIDGDAARGFRRWRQGSDLQCADTARLHDDYLAHRWRDRYQERRHRQHSPAGFHHANRDDHADPADLGCLHAAAEGRARGAGSDGQGRAHDGRVWPGRSHEAR